jgi:hypothetical protein
MGELIRIGAQEGAPGLGATIDTTGAWVTSLSLGKDHVFFPRDLVATGPDELKFRGGMHVCSPYFGTDPSSKGPQHGNARLSEWRIKEPRSNNHLSLVLEDESWANVRLSQRLTYLLNGNWFAALLDLKNLDDSTEIEVSPGFHPYFAGRENDNECGPEPATDKHTQVYDGRCSLRDIVLNNGIGVNMWAMNLPEGVAWSDNPEEYHCIEPTSYGLGPATDQTDKLSPGQTQSYMVTLKIEPT